MMGHPYNDIFQEFMNEKSFFHIRGKSILLFIHYYRGCRDPKLMLNTIFPEVKIIPIHFDTFSL